MKPVQGDDPIKGKAEKLNFYTDNIYIDQLRGGADCGGRIFLS